MLVFFYSQPMYCSLHPVFAHSKQCFIQNLSTFIHFFITVTVFTKLLSEPKTEQDSEATSFVLHGKGEFFWSLLIKMSGKYEV
jgi:hypothetical protein